MDVSPQLLQSQATQRRLKLFADGADVASFKALYRTGEVDGFTTNPTLMFKAGIRDYAAFAQELLSEITELPISFEVFSDDLAEMEMQARRLASWGRNVYVKIPVTNTQGTSCAPVVRNLSRDGIKLNVTAILTLRQVAETLGALSAETPSIISIFAGRIADTGRDPVPLMTAAIAMAEANPLAEILWASPREVLNIHQARACGAHIITATPDILKKMSMSGMDLDRLSRDTVKMFRQDAVAAGFQL